MTIIQRYEELVKMTIIQRRTHGGFCYIISVMITVCYISVTISYNSRLGVSTKQNKTKAP